MSFTPFHWGWFDLSFRGGMGRFNRSISEPNHTGSSLYSSVWSNSTILLIRDIVITSASPHQEHSSLTIDRISQIEPLSPLSDHWVSSIDWVIIEISLSIESINPIHDLSYWVLESIIETPGLWFTVSLLGDWVNESLTEWGLSIELIPIISWINWVLQWILIEGSLRLSLYLEWALIDIPESQEMSLVSPYWAFTWLRVIKGSMNYLRIWVNSLDWISQQYWVNDIGPFLIESLSLVLITFNWGLSSPLSSSLIEILYHSFLQLSWCP